MSPKHPHSIIRGPDALHRAIFLFDAALGKNGKTLAALSEECGYDLEKWKLAPHRFDVRKASIVCQAIDFTDQDAEQFILGVNPDILNHLKKEQLAQKIKEKAWEYIDFPEFDSRWFKDRDFKGTPGLFVKFYRTEKGLSSTVLASSSGCSVKALSQWENGAKPMSYKHCNAIAGALGLSAKNTETLKELIRQESLMRPKKTSLGAVRLNNKDTRLDAPEPDPEKSIP